MKTKYGFITNSIVPLRAEPDDRAELETQLLFGDTFQVVEIFRQWRKIIHDFDGYTGWIDEKSFWAITAKEYHKLKSAANFYVADLISTIQLPDKSFQNLVLGSRIPHYDEEKRQFQINGQILNFKGQIWSGKKSLNDLFAVAEKYRNAPYLWGGMTPFGIDCSGFTQMIYKITGLYNLPRNASQQALEGVRIDFDQRQAGDLAFFVNEQGKIHHVGLVWFHNQILHAHGKVRLDELLPEGIYNREQQKLTHTLVLIKRL